MPPDDAARLTAADVVYDAVGVLAAAVCIPALPYLLWRGFGHGLGQRLGCLPEPVKRLGPRPVWIHAASVGETLAAAPLVARIREALPEVPILTSSTTLTGQAVALSDLRPDAVTLLPVDALRIVARAMRRVRPRCLVLVETEIWPGLVRAAAGLGVPVVMVSGTLSERSARRFRRVAPVVRAALERISRFGMQTETDADRVVALGAPPERVSVTGSLKAGRAAAIAGPPPVAGLEGRAVLVAASTQPGEEEFVLDACRRLWDSRPDLLLLIAPRRPERFDAVCDLVARGGLRYQRRTDMTDGVERETRVLVLDTVGELARLLPCARAAFVGGTIAPIGGHNLLEPAACGKPVAFGPGVENVKHAAELLLAAGGGRTVHSANDLAELWGELLADPRQAEAMGERARRAAEQGSDAVERTWTLLAPFLRDGVTGAEAAR